jgi:N-dimethylarginine dimethylaminohydrolase
VEARLARFLIGQVGRCRGLYVMFRKTRICSVGDLENVRDQHVVIGSSKATYLQARTDVKRYLGYRTR